MSHPLRIKEFRIYWIGQIISLSGSWMQIIAQSWLIYFLTKSAFYLGLISFLSSSPMLIFTLFGGVLADRYPRRKILIITQFLSLFPALIIGILIDLDAIKIWHIAFASLFLGVAGAFDMPARQAFITEIVTKDMITSAIAMQSISFNIARILGPFFAGIIVSSLNFQTCFYINALSFIPLIIILLKIKLKDEISHEKNLSLKDSLKEGFRFLYSHKQILCIICSVGIFTLFGVSFMTVLPLIAGEILKVGAKGFGIIVSSIGIGSLIAGILIALKKDISEKQKHIFQSSLLFPAGLIGVAMSKNLHITIGFAFLLGFAFVNFFAISNSFIQHLTEKRLRGRIMSFFSFVFLGFTPIGNLLTGILVEEFGIKPILQFYAFLCFLGGVIFLKILPDIYKKKAITD